jgi:hypothetical protein
MKILAACLALAMTGCFSATIGYKDPRSGAVIGLQFGNPVTPVELPLPTGFKK